MSQQTRAIWDRFDQLAAAAQDPQTKLLVEALKLHAELMNTHLSGIAHLAGTMAQLTTAAPGRTGTPS